MTATITTCPFPMPNQPLQSRAQMDALPPGSVIAYLRDEFGSYGSWTKTTANLWRDTGGDEDDLDGDSSEDFTVPDTGSNGEEFGVISIPELTVEQLVGLPVGTLVWRTHDNRPYRKYREVDGTGADLVLCWERDDGEHHNCYIAPAYLISTPESEEVTETAPFAVGERCDDRFPQLPVGSRIVMGDQELPCVSYRKTADNNWQYLNRQDLEAADDFTDAQFAPWHNWRVVELPSGNEPVLIPYAAVTAGMYVQHPAGASRFFVFEVNDNDYWNCLGINPPDGVSTLTSFDPSSSETYQVIPHDDVLLMALASLTRPEPVNTEALVQQGRDERNQWWSTQMQRFNEAAQRLAVDKGYCSDYDSFVEEWEHLGLTRRVVNLDFSVDVEVTGTITTRVTMPEGSSPSDIYDAALEEIGIREDSTWTINGETINVTSVSGEDYEEV